jgi:hypothetical protein
MTIEILYLTAQMQRWLNVRVARHLEAQAARIRSAKGTVTTLGADGPGGSVGLDRRGMPEDCYSVDEPEGVATMDEAAAVAPSAVLDSEKHTEPA